MVTHSNVRCFVIVAKVGFIKFVDSRSTEVFRDSVPLKEDVVVEAGVFDMRFLWEIKQTGHRGDQHDSTISVHVRWVSVEIAYEENVILITVRFLDIPINVRQCLTSDFLAATFLPQITCTAMIEKSKPPA